MPSLNKIQIIGHLGKDPESKFAPNGTQITRFSVATTENIKRGDNWEPETDWHNIVLFKKQAEYAAEYLKKGLLVYIEGKVKYKSWEDQEGNKKYMTEIIGHTIKNLSPKSDQPKQDKKETPPQQTQPKDDLPF